MDGNINISDLNYLFYLEFFFQKYALTLAQQLHVQRIKSGEKLGVPIDLEDIDNMRDEQIAQLYELMKEATTKE